MIEHLRSWTQCEENEMLKKHSAIALALLGDNSALPVIRDMVAQRDSFVLQDNVTCRRYNQMRGYIAIYLIGKLTDIESVDELIDIICNPNEIKRPLYNDRNLVINDYRIDGYKDIFAQFFTFSIMALLKIGEKHPILRTKIQASLLEALKDDLYIKIITFDTCRYEYSIAANIKNVVKKIISAW
jgi:hypothetical protein